MLESNDVLNSWNIIINTIIKACVDGDTAVSGKTPRVYSPTP